MPDTQATKRLFPFRKQYKQRHGLRATKDERNTHQVTYAVAGFVNPSAVRQMTVMLYSRVFVLFLYFYTLLHRFYSEFVF